MRRAVSPRWLTAGSISAMTSAVPPAPLVHLTYREHPLAGIPMRSTLSMGGSLDGRFFAVVAAAALIAAPTILGLVPLGDPDNPGGPPANEGALEGPGGTAVDPGLNNAGAANNRTNGVPTGGNPSPLFGALPFSQQMLLFEEFGTAPMPTAFPLQPPFPQPQDAQHGPAAAALDQFLAQPLFPAPTRLANDRDANPWRAAIEAFLGRQLVTPPAEGRPPGEGWAHQRFAEFPPQVWTQSCIADARRNTGLRDARQLHGYAVGEVAPGGRYHNTPGQPGSEGTTAGIVARLHRRMPVPPPNAVRSFDGTLPPTLLMARHGIPVLCRNYDALPIDPAANFGFGLHTLTTHEHNGHQPAESDGFLNAFFFPGQYYDYRWPLQLAGYDTVNTDASDPRAATPDGNGGTVRIRGDWRETESSHWFHDHMNEFTAQNVYKGSAAMLNYYSALDRGNEGIDDGVNLRLPSGTALDWGNRDYDVNLLIADKAWTRDGQLWFNIFNKDGFIGDRVLTNWLWNPYLEVRARRYRFRILNGAVSRFFKIALVDEQGQPVPFHMVANDGNIMEHSVAFDGTLGTQRGILPEQGIAERYDIVVDFSRFAPGARLWFVNVLEHQTGKVVGQQIPLRDIVSGAYHPVARDEDGDGLPDRWRDGDPCVGKFLELRVRAYGGVDHSMNPAEFIAGRRALIPLPRPTQQELANARHRTFEFGRSGGSDRTPWTIATDGGEAFPADPRRVSAAPNLGELSAANLGHVEVWTIRNGGNGWSHPVHVHFEENLFLRKDDHTPPEWERWARKDMVRIGPEPDAAREIEVALRIREFAGTYMEHCHNTQHEDNAMLLRWDSERPGQLTFFPAPIPTWDGVEFVDSVALPTARTGDGTGPRR